MPIKPLFRNNTSLNEQRLIEDLVVEAIKQYGIDVYYIRRKSLNRDTIIQDDKASIFDAAYAIEMYIKSVEGFEGEGDFLSKFGLEIRDRMMFTVSRRSFKNYVTQESPKHIRPMEGDLIFFPLNRKLFEIKFVEHESVFYQMGSLQTFDLTCELYEFNNETFATGVDVIDDIYKFRLNTNLLELNDSAISGPDDQPIESQDGSIIGVTKVDPETNDPLAINSDVEWEGRKYIDWSEKDPFSDGGVF